VAEELFPSFYYKLEDEPLLAYDMLFTMDGNDLQKCVLQCRSTKIGPDSEPVVGPVIQHIDTWIGNSDYYLSQAKVDR